MCCGSSGARTVVFGGHAFEVPDDATDAQIWEIIRAQPAFREDPEAAAARAELALDDVATQAWRAAAHWPSDLLGVPVDLVNAGDRAMDWLDRVTGLDHPELGRPQLPGGSADLGRWLIEPLIGPTPEAETDAGRYVGAIVSGANPLAGAVGGLARIPRVMAAGGAAGAAFEGAHDAGVPDEALMLAALMAGGLMPRWAGEAAGPRGGPMPRSPQGAGGGSLDLRVAETAIPRLPQGLPWYDDALGTGVGHGASSIVAASSGRSGDRIFGSGTGAPPGTGGVRPRDPGREPGRPAFDPEGRPLTAPILVDRSLPPDQVELAARLLNDSVGFAPRPMIADRAGEEANAMHELFTMADGSHRRVVTVADDVPVDEIPGLLAHEGIGHGIRSYVSPTRKFTVDDLTINPTAADPDYAPLNQMMDASGAIKGPPYGTVAVPDEDFAYFVQRLVTDYDATRAVSPEAVTLLRRMWNGRAEAARTIQFYSLLAAGVPLSAALTMSDRGQGSLATPGDGT
jgi:hypothetical protein